MKQKHINRLLKLANFLEKKIPKRYFDMSMFLGEGEDGRFYRHANISCGTPGCALGWATAIFKDLCFDIDTENIINRRKPWLDQDSWTTARDFFGIDDQCNIQHLFGPRSRTAKQEAKVIKDFVRRYKDETDT